MILDAMHRVTKNPMEVAAAMVAGAFAPQLLGQGSGGVVPTTFLPPLAGAATYYYMDDIQDSTSMVIGAMAGYVGPMLMMRVRGFA